MAGGCAGMSYDLRLQKNPYDNDIVFAQGDLQIFVNPESVPFLKSVEINYVDTLKESGFQYKKSQRLRQLRLRDVLLMKNDVKPQALPI